MEIVDLSPLFYTKKKKPDERNWWGENAPGLDEKTCRFLSESGVKAVGADTSACDMAHINGQVIAEFGPCRLFPTQEHFDYRGATRPCKGSTNILFYSAASQD
jgi:kynurenine formamidase